MEKTSISLTLDFEVENFSEENSKKRTISFSRFDLGRLLVQFINGILTGPMSRNVQAANTLKDLLTIHIQLRHDELYLLFETIFRHLNRDDDDTNPNFDHQLNQMSIRVETKTKTMTISLKFSFRNRSIFFAG